MKSPLVRAFALLVFRSVLAATAFAQKSAPPPPAPTPRRLLPKPVVARGFEPALDAILFVRDPFPVINPLNLFKSASDPNTRVLVFVRNVAANETADAVKINLVDSNNHAWNLDAEDVRVDTNSDFSQVRFRLPDTLAPGICTIQITIHGQVSNTSFIQIKP